MNDIDFFKHYLPALRKALDFKSDAYDFNVYGPDWFIDDENLRNELDLFEEINFEKYELLFQMVATYLDARAHNFKKIGELSVNQFREKLESIILNYEEKWP